MRQALARVATRLCRKSRRSASPSYRPASTLDALERRQLFAIVNVSDVAGLVNAVNNGLAGDTVNLAAGTYELTAPLKPKAGMIIQGAGQGSTIVTGAASWNPGTAAIPEGGVTASAINTNAYLFSFNSGTHNVSISNMTLTGPQLHGAMYGYDPDGLQMSNLTLDNFLWSGIRTFSMANGDIYNNTFVNTGGRWNTGGTPGTTGGITGGAMYLTWSTGMEIHNNVFKRSGTLATDPAREFYGVKGREMRNSRIHHNTFDNRSFSIELPFEHDYNVEIDHNYLGGTISLPRSGGGTVPTGAYSFWIHHNYFRSSYSLEYTRSKIEIDHNLFDFNTASDGGNLITNFFANTAPAATGTKFHNNLIKNPGRGLYNTNGNGYTDFQFYNNHVIANTTVTPRTEGMFSFGATTAGTDYSTIGIKDNIFQFVGTSRPLFKNSAGYASQVSNNSFSGVTDTANYANPSTGATQGLTAPLLFDLGARNQFQVDGWTLKRNAIDDSFVRASSTYANDNYGSQTTMALKNDSSATYDRDVYLKFDLTGISSSASSIVLNLFGTQSASTSVVPINVYSATNTSWGESSITWNNKPASGTTIHATQNTPGNTTGKWYAFNLTSFIASEISAGRTQATLVLKMPTTGGTLVTFNSEENAANRPYLSVT